MIVDGWHRRSMQAGDELYARLRGPGYQEEANTR